MLIESDGPWIEEEDLDIEDDEEHRGEEVLDWKSTATLGLWTRLDTALISLSLRSVIAPRSCDSTCDDGDHSESETDREERDDRHVGIHKEPS